MHHSYIHALTHSSGEDAEEKHTCGDGLPRGCCHCRAAQGAKPVICTITGYTHSAVDVQHAGVSNARVSILQEWQGDLAHARNVCQVFP